jgi:hypothetical protein
MLKYFYQNESDIPAERKDLYEQRDGGWWLKVEGAVPKAKLDEFRDKNLELQGKLRTAEEALKPYTEAGVDLAKYKDLTARERDLAEGALYKKGELDNIIADRTKGIKEEHERALKAIKDAADAKQRDLDAALLRESKLVIDQGLIAAARKRQLKPGTEDVVLALARDHWKMVDGKPQAFGPEELATGKPFLFAESTGSNEPGSAGAGAGAGGGGGGSGNPGYNPWGEKTWNMTKQMEMTQKNPAEAKRLCEAAGRKWVPPAKPTGAPATAAAR